MVVNVHSGRARKIISRFPAFTRLENPGKALSHICGVLGVDLDDLERQLSRVQQARRIHYAPEEIDVTRLGALIGLRPADFIILRKLYENGFFQPIPPGEDGSKNIRDAYSRYIRSMGERVTRIAELLMEGCGTVWSLLEGTAILLNAKTLDFEKSARIQTVDTHPLFGGFVHRTPVQFKSLIDQKWQTQTDYIYVLENPIEEKSSGLVPCRQRTKIIVNRRGFFHGKVTASITGVSNRTVKPMLINLETQEGIGYNGVVKAGEILQFTQDGVATLDGLDVTKDCYFFKGALIDSKKGFSVDGENNHKQSWVASTPPGAMNRNFPRPFIVPLDQIPVVRLRLGSSIWRFSVEEGAFDASAFDTCVYSFPKSEKARKKLGASGEVELVWNEHTPFSTTVLIPRTFQSYEGLLLNGQDLLRHLREGLERFRAAGVDLNVAYFDTEWLLGKSMLEDESELNGVGVTIEGTAIS